MHWTVWSEPLGEMVLSQPGARSRRKLFAQERSSTEGLFIACERPKVKIVTTVRTVSPHISCGRDAPVRIGETDRELFHNFCGFSFS